MKKTNLHILKFLSVFLLLLSIVLPASAENHLAGKVIALDAGHGGGEMGAAGECGGNFVFESEVNLAVRASLTERLEAADAIVFQVPPLSSRKDRVAAAEDAGADVLISIHHNGSSDASVDYTQSFVTQKNDKELAKPIHDALVLALNLPDKGIKSDGYGMTVYGSLPGVLTESYFISNTKAACDFLGERVRVLKEVEAMFDGLSLYFRESGAGGGDGGGKPDKCSPWPSCNRLSRGESHSFFYLRYYFNV